MFENLYEWIQKIAFYLVLITAVMQAVPNKEYKKYIRFFTGLVLILMLLTPILKVFGTEVGAADFYESPEYKQVLQEYEMSLKELEGAENEGEVGAEETEEESRMGEIRVEEIQID